MDKIWDTNPSKSELIGGDEKTEWHKWKNKITSRYKLLLLYKTHGRIISERTFPYFMNLNVTINLMTLRAEYTIPLPKPVIYNKLKVLNSLKLTFHMVV